MQGAMGLGLATKSTSYSSEVLTAKRESYRQTFVIMSWLATLTRGILSLNYQLSMHTVSYLLDGCEYKREVCESNISQQFDQVIN